jgi:hypothetical protein
MHARSELPIERFRYWQGQMVRGRDFRDQIAAAGRQAGWHNRAIHAAFGVRFGFDVTLAAIDPPRVTIACGVAFDCAGAMLTLQQPRELAVPRIEAGASAVLLVRSRTGGSTCGCNGASAGRAGDLLEADLVFTWAAGYHGDADAGVPLARIDRQASGALDVDATIRILARPFARPRLGSGDTIPGLAPWELWALGVQTRVDTTAAGFTRIPCYFAVLTVTRQPKALPILPPLFKTHLTDAGLSSFTLRVLLAEGLRALMPEASRAYGLTVCWTGCQEPEELPAACPAQEPASEGCTTVDFGIDRGSSAPACGGGCNGR